MNIFTCWWQKKSRKMDNIPKAPQQHLQASSGQIICGVDVHQYQPYLSHSSYGPHEIKSLPHMLCPLYSSDLLHYNNSDTNTRDTSPADNDMDLLSYQYTLQNAILSIGTLGGESLNQMAAEIDNENTISTLGVPLVDSRVRIIDSSTSAQGIAQISMCSSDRVQVRRGFEQASSANIVNTNPKLHNVVKDGEEGDNENMATHSNGLKVAFTCNHHMDLKRFIVAVTPNDLPKHLLKRLKLGNRQMQMDRPDCTYQCKFYKLLRMLGLKQSSRSCNVMKRELGPLAVEDVQIDSKEYADNNEQEFIKEVMSSSLQTIPEESSFQFHNSNMIITSNENWISTDDEYVVLELEEHIQ